MNKQSWIVVIALVLVGFSCGDTGSHLVIRGQESVSAAGFDTTMVVTSITEEQLRNAGHLLIQVEVNAMSFQERSYVERYLEAGGLVTFSCRDTVYNWGQLRPFWEAGTVS